MFPAQPAAHLSQAVELLPRCFQLRTLLASRHFRTLQLVEPSPPLQMVAFCAQRARARLAFFHAHAFAPRAHRLQRQRAVDQSRPHLRHPHRVMHAATPPCLGCGELRTPKLTSPRASSCFSTHVLSAATSHASSSAIEPLVRRQDKSIARHRKQPRPSQRLNRFAPEASALLLCAKENPAVHRKVDGFYKAGCVPPRVYETHVLDRLGAGGGPRRAAEVASHSKEALRQACRREGLLGAPT